MYTIWQKLLIHPTCKFPAEVKQHNLLLSYFNSYTINKYPFCSLFSAMFFIFLSFLLMMSLFKMPRHSTKLLPSVPEHRKAVRCLSEGIYVLEMLHSGMSNSAVVYEFSVNESTIWYIQEEEIHWCICIRVLEST